MTVLPPGLIPPHERHITVVAIERPSTAMAVRDRPSTPHRPSVRSIAFVALVALTVVALVVTAMDLLNG